jgi:hypothetical protein
MPTLEIAVDARGVPQGLEQANRALDQTAKKADRAEKEVKDLGHSAHTAGRDMSAAFAATGGGLAITHGIEGMASGFRSGNSAMAAFAASQALLDLGRFAEDMRSVSAATGGATSIFGTLGNVMRAHPLMTIATVLAGAASAMALFADDTEDANAAFEALAANMQKARMSEGARQMLGLGIGPALQQRQQAVTSLAEMFQPGQPSMTYGRMGELLGPDFGVGRLREMQEARGVRFAEQYRERTVRPGVTVKELLPPEARTVSRQAAAAILRTVYQQLQAQVESAGGAAAAMGAKGAAAGFMGPTLPAGFSQYADPSLLPLMRDRAAAPTPAPLGPTLPPGFQQFADPRLLPTLGNFQGTYTGGQPEALTGGIGMPFGTGFGIQFGMQAGAQMQAYAQEQAVLAQQRMDELIAQGEQFGQTIGDAFFRVAEGTMTARQAMAELVRMFAQMGAQSVFRQIGGAVGGAFGQTQAQATANADPGPIAPNA